MRSWTPLLPVACVVLAGCATPGAVGGARPGGEAPWHLATTERFEVWTDAGPEAAGQGAAELERLQALLDLAFPEVERGTSGQLRVVLLASHTAVEELAGPHIAGFYTRRTAQPTVVIGARQALRDPSLLAHELTHHLVERWLVRAPRWLDEGLAEHLGTIGDPRVDAGTMGQAPRWAADWRPEPGFVRRLLDWDGRISPEAPRRELDAAWALVHFLATTEPRRFADFLRALVAGTPAEQAFAVAFPEWRPDDLMGPYRLELRVRAALATGRRRLWVFPPPSRRAELVVRAAPLAEVHLLRLELPRRQRLPLEAVRAEVEAALRADPHHPEALRWKAQLQGGPPLSLADRATEAHPDDWRSWRFLAAALPAGAGSWEREAALQLAVELAPGRPEPLLALARFLAEDGRPGEAEPLARRAAEAAPWDTAAVTGYAALASIQGACPVSSVAAARAVALRADPALDPERRAMAHRLHALDLRCEHERFSAAAWSQTGLAAGRP